MWNANVAHEAAGARRLNGLQHGFLRSDTLQNCVGANTLRKLLEAIHAFVTAFCDDLGCTKFERELLTVPVAAHRDDSLCTHLLCREDSQQADRSIANDSDGHPWLHMGSIGGEPASTENIRGRQQAGDDFLRRRAWCGNKGAVRQRDSQERRLRTTNELAMLA